MTDATMRAHVLRLVREWHEETAFLSVWKVGHPKARALVALGPEVVPYLFEALAEQSTHSPDPNASEYPWSMWLIREILSDGPTIPKEQAGRIRWIVGAYRAWGRERGYLL